MKNILILIFIYVQFMHADISKAEANKKVDSLLAEISTVNKIRRYHKTYKKFFIVSQRVVQNDPTNFKAHAFLGHYYMTQEISLSLAKFHFAQALKYNSSDPQYSYMLGIIYGMENDFINAKKYFELGLNIDTDTTNYGYLFSAKADELKGDRAKAITNYNRAIETDINNNSKEMAYFLRGKVYLDNEQIQEAIESFDEMLIYYPKSKSGLNGLAIAYEKDMQYDNSKDIYNRLIKYYHDDYIGYLGYFEIQLILGQDFDDDKVNFYLRAYSNDTVRMAQFDLLKILKSAIDDSTYKNGLQRWNNYYKDIDVLKHWSLDEVISWTYTIDDEKKRNRLLEVLVQFKDKKIMK